MKEKSSALKNVQKNTTRRRRRRRRRLFLSKP
jgi:hypothetical protein